MLYHAQSDEYIAELAAASRAYQEHNTQQYLHAYYGEFYHYDPGHFYYGEGQEEADGAVARQVEQDLHDGDTVAVESCKEIPFRDQDDPSDSSLAGCLNAS